MATVTPEATESTTYSRFEFLSPLKNRNFAFLTAGRVTSNMGRNMRVFARAWLVLELTNSPFLLGLVTSSLSWPMLFMPFIGGILADRVDRRKLLLYTEFSLAVLWFGVSIVIALGWIQWWHLMMTSILSGIIQSIGRPGQAAMIGTLVTKKQLSSAVAIDAAADQWPRAIGLAIATYLIVFIGTGGLFWFTAFLQLFTGITLLFIKMDPQEVELRKGMGVRGSVFDGLRFVKDQPIIIGLVVVGVAASLFSGSGFLMPVFARDILNVGAQGLGTLMLASTLGVSLGSFLVMALANYHRRGALLVAGTLLATAFSVGFSQSTIFYLSIGLTFCMGMFTTMRSTSVEMIMQLLAPNEMRGRVMSLRVSIQGFSFIGVMALGALAEVVGASKTMLIGASTSGLVALVIFIVMPQIRRFR